MQLCSQCPHHPSCTNCLNLIDGGLLRKKVSPPKSIILYDEEQSEYHGWLIGISRIGMLVETNAPLGSYSVKISDHVTVYLSPIYHKGLSGLIAFDIVKVVRENQTDEQLSREEYEYLVLEKKEIISKLTENLEDSVKQKIREELETDLHKSELLDRLLVGASYRYDKGRIRQLSGEQVDILKESDLIKLMKESIKQGAPARELFIDTDREKYIDVHAVPTSFQSGAFLALDVTEIVKKEKELLKEQWENYKEVVLSLTNGKIHLIHRQELNEMLNGYAKQSEMHVEQAIQLAAVRQWVTQSLQAKGLEAKVGT
ncbi:hypothetical protein GCM10010965_31420 [Caldalkalibacillus thermarum]|uniref:hypothetical protein n=1 Tax=Caldalkalibacillus thermarum TaxID=296745 RepID=UPI0016647035|nr:hypothetical protein [Caldalkalibacillus thermarum]GGK36172.1 hypothetical protein GCM10010965_31420 [Caldalkalibacillus thermarum]